MRLRGIRKGIANACLLLVSCTVGLALCEVSLRLFYPKYRNLADAQFSRDAERLWSRMPHQRSYGTHPDTGSLHLLYHNNLALRQHRNFSSADLTSATNIGVFGDSYTENINMSVQYSFTEPLDYLLNQSGKRFNVLNFGVDGYGTGQSLLRYEHVRHAADLAHVLYVYCQNDLSNISTRDLFRLDEAGYLVRNEVMRVSWWKPLVKKWHATYLLLDVSDRLSSSLVEVTNNREDLADLRRGLHRTRLERALKNSSRHGRLSDDKDADLSVEIFRRLLRRWKRLVEHNGNTFSVVLLPLYPPQPFIVDLLSAEGVEVIDLYACFSNADPAHPQRSWPSSPYRFKNDAHWNEAGNRLAAVCLYRDLEEKTGLPPLSEGRLQETLSQYYAAFGAIPHRRLGGG